MKLKYFGIVGIILASALAIASATRTIDVDVLKSSDHTKVWTPPAATDTLVGKASTDVLTHKTMDGATNVWTNIPLATAVTGTLPAASLPNPSASTLGGVESLAAVSHNFLTSISTGGAPTQAQPAFTDISGTAQIAQGGTGVGSVTVAPAATSFAGWDANKNLSAANLLDGYTTTATAAGTTTLVVGSNFQQYFTGSTTQTVLLPVTSTLVLGQQYLITNLSSGVVTVQSSGANALQAMAQNSQLLATVISTSGTGTASWSWTYGPTGSTGLPLTNPMTTGGDIIYGGSSGTATRLANGSNGQLLTSAGGTSAPTWTSPGAITIQTKTTTYGILATDGLVLCSASAFTATLPTAVGNTGTTIRVKKTDATAANIITVATTSSQTIDGNLTFTLNTLDDMITVVSDGSNWQIIEHTWNQAPTSFTPTGSISTNTTFSGYWIRTSAQEITVINTIAFSGVNTQAAVTVNIPNSSTWTINTTPILSTANVRLGVLLFQVHGGGASDNGYVSYSSSTAVSTAVFQVNGTRIDNAGINTSTNVPVTIANGDAIWLKYTIPITGFSG